MNERALGFGCWLNGHAIIRLEFMANCWRCRCGKRAITAQALHARYHP